MKKIITGDDVEFTFRSGGKEINLGPKDIITSIAKEKAEKYGILLLRAETPPEEKETGLKTQAGPQARFNPFSGPESKSTGPSVPVQGTSPPFDMEYWRNQFPILKNYVHVANCSQAPQSTFTRNAALEYLDNWNQMGMDWDHWIEEVRYAKEEFAKIINASPEEIAIGTSVSELTGVVASALPLNVGRKKIAVTEAEFPTVGHVWQAMQKYGFNTVFIPVKNGLIDVTDYDRCVDADTLITSICDVYYYNGFKQDLSRIIPIIHSKGSLVYVDAYQGLGTHPVDVKALDIDFLASGNLKYLLGVPGIAFLYVKKEIIEHLQPAFTGWFGRKQPFAFDIHTVDFAEDARRFDTGTPPVPTAYIARGGMRIINTVGVEAIYQWTNLLSEHCLKGALQRGLDVVSPRDLKIKAPNTAIRVPGNSHDFELALRKRGVIASARGDVVRIAPHFFTRIEDIDYVLDCYLKTLNS